MFTLPSVVEELLAIVEASFYFVFKTSEGRSEMGVINALDYNNEVFRGFITWSGLLIVKLLLMAFLTSFQRMRTGVSYLDSLDSSVNFAC